MADSKTKSKSTSNKSTQSSNTGGNMKDKLVPVLVVLVVLGAFAVGLLYGKVQVYEDAIGGVGSKVAQQGGDGDDAVPQAPPDVPEDVPLSADQWDKLLVDPAASKGDGEASVVMVEYTDYQCPFCARYVEDAYAQIVENYVETGDVYYLLRDLPLAFHANAKPAALAARCAGDQDLYWEMHDQLFTNQTEWSEGDPAEAFAGYAGDISADVDEWQSCYESGEHDDVIDADLALAGEVGANGTPTFFINGEKIVGAQPYSAFEAMLNEALGE